MKTAAKKNLPKMISMNSSRPMARSCFKKLLAELCLLSITLKTGLQGIEIICISLIIRTSSANS
jgi:hypothetical protein